MTDTTDTAALREECAQWVKEAIGEAVDTHMALNGDGNDYMSWDMSVIWLAWLHLSGKLEAERQRADAARKYGSERDSENESLMLTVGRLRAEIAALKGEQVPVGLIEAGLPAVNEGEFVYVVRSKQFIPYGTSLFTAAPKPVVVLSDCDIAAVSHMAHWYSEEQCEAWVAGVEYAKKQMLAAGIVVKDGE